ncbi:MAG: methionine--tRNA ligase [Acidobacteriota bacterium]
MSRFYVTTPIYYVNGMPHIGHIFTTVVADTLARYRRSRGQEVRFLTGTDEHGQNIERAAENEGIRPIELADRIVERYHELWKILDISHEDFVRTTEDRHARGVEEMIQRLVAAEDLYTARHEGWYCPSCETFYTDKELVPENRCPVHETAAEWHSEENIFFRLSNYQQPLLDLFEQHPEFVQPGTRLNEVRSFVESGLRDLSVSRAGLTWGIPFPEHEGQTVYVWLDALTNYISALGFGSEATDLYDTFWQGGDERLHLVGKDILRFHAVYWPAFLMSAGLPLPTTVWAHGWWLLDKKKVSKSVGNVVRPDALIERFGADSLRYFLLREMVFGQDAQFSDEGFIERYNSDLANTLGNTVSRLVTLSRRAFGGQTPPLSCDDNPLIGAAEEAVVGFHQAMGELAFSRALESLWKLLSQANQYIVEREPWKMIKDESKRDALARVLWNGLEATRIATTALLPFMPQVAPKVLAAIAGDAENGDLDWGGTPVDAELPESGPLFPRIDQKAYLAEIAAAAEAESSNEQARQQAAEMEEPSDEGLIKIDQFFESELRVGTVKLAEAVPKSNKLLRLEIDLGEETLRQVVAGIAKQYAPEDLVGTQVVVVANLAPAKLMGVQSRGMVLAATVDGQPVVIRPETPVENGTRVS